MLQIYQKHLFIIIIVEGAFLKIYIKSVIHKTEGMVKLPIIYLIHIKILSFHMEIICFQQHMTLQWKQCVHINHQTMHYHIGNVFCVVVRNVHVCTFQVQNQISTIQKLAPQYDFISINTYYVVLCMEYALSMKKKHFQLCETHSDSMFNEKCIPQRACHYVVINCGLSSRLIYPCNSETFISTTTFTHS